MSGGLENAFAPGSGSTYVLTSFSGATATGAPLTIALLSSNTPDFKGSIVCGGLNFKFYTPAPPVVFTKQIDRSHSDKSSKMQPLLN